jgi:hypothetical protein
MLLKHFEAVWLMPLLLVIQEEETRRTIVRNQLGQIIHKTLSWKHTMQKGLAKWLKE